MRPARHDRGAADDQPEQQDVADRVGQVDRDPGGAPARVVQDVREREGRAQRRRAEPGHAAVQPAGQVEALDVGAQQQHQPDVGDRIERDVERIGERG